MKFEISVIFCKDPKTLPKICDLSMMRKLKNAQVFASSAAKAADRSPSAKNPAARACSPRRAGQRNLFHPLLQCRTSGVSTFNEVKVPNRLWIVFGCIEIDFFKLSPKRARLGWRDGCSAWLRRKTAQFCASGHNTVNGFSNGDGPSSAPRPL